MPLTPNFTKFKRYELYLLLVVGVLPELKTELEAYAVPALVLTTLVVLHKVAVVMLAFVLEDKGEDR